MQQWYVPYMALAPKGSFKVYLVSSVIHFNVITVDIDMLISIVKHCACEWQGEWNDWVSV